MRKLPWLYAHEDSIRIGHKVDKQTNPRLNWCMDYDKPLCDFCFFLKVNLIRL